MSTSGRAKAPWEDYSQTVVGDDSAEMDAAVQAYAQNRHDRSSQQSLEELARWQEGNREIAKEYQFVKPEEYADIGPRRGKIYTYDQFITILRTKCKLNCWYREMNHPQKLALVAQKDGFSLPEVVGWVQRPYMQEYEVVRFDEHGVPLDSRFRGWRSVCMQLALKGFLKENTIERAFGRACGPASEKYNKFMQSLRQNYGL